MLRCQKVTRACGRDYPISGKDLPGTYLVLWKRFTGYNDANSLSRGVPLKTADVKRVGIVVQLSRLCCRNVALAIAAVGRRARWEWLQMPFEGTPMLTTASGDRIHGAIGRLANIRSIVDRLSSGLPMVDIAPAVTESGIVRVTNDDVGVGCVASAYLLSLGLTNYGFFGHRARDDSILRERGFKQALAAAGFSCESFHWPAGELGDASEELHGNLVRWLAALPKPVGVLASDDYLALQLLAICGRLGIAVPDAVAVLGVENDEALCELASPSLSSVALSTQMIGYEAARTLELLMHGQAPNETTRLIPPVGVVPRASTGLRVILDEDVAAAIRYIALHVKDNLQVADVLREIQVSRRSLDQRFKKVLGHTAATEIGRAQLEAAKRVLAETNESMDRVAAIAGFTNAKQMGAAFRVATGLVPTDYRRKHRLYDVQ